MLNCFLPVYFLWYSTYNGVSNQVLQLSDKKYDWSDTDRSSENSTVRGVYTYTMYRKEFLEFVLIAHVKIRNHLIHALA